MSESFAPLWLVKYVKAHAENNEDVRIVIRGIVNMSHKKIMRLAKSFGLTS